MLVESLMRVAPATRLVTIDTGVLFAETLDTWRAFEQRFGAHIEVEDARGSLDRSGELLRRRQGRGARARARRRRRLGHRDPPRAVTDARGRRRRPSSTSAAGSASTTRSRAGASRTSGTSSASASCPTTSSTTAATPRSAARPAPGPAAAARAAGPAWTRPSAACTSRPDQRGSIRLNSSWSSMISLHGASTAQPITPPPSKPSRAKVLPPPWAAATRSVLSAALKRARERGR